MEKNERIKFFVTFTILTIFSVGAFFDVFNKDAYLFLSDSLTFAISNLGIVSLVKILTGSLKVLSGFSDIADKIFNLVFFSSVLIYLQYILIVLNKILIIKILILVFLLLSIVKSFRKLFFKIVIILLFINPGLNIYITALKYISEESKLELGRGINNDINEFKNLDFGMSTDKKEEPKESIDKKSFFQSIKDVFSFDSLKETTTRFIDESISSFNQKVQALLEMSIKYFLNVVTGQFFGELLL